MLSLLSGSTVYRVSVTVEINGVPVTADLHLRISGGNDWTPYVTPELKESLGVYFSSVDATVYHKFLLVILEVIFLLKFPYLQVVTLAIFLGGT